MNPLLIRRLDALRALRGALVERLAAFCERNLLANVDDRDIDLDGPGRRYERAWDDRREDRR